MFQKISLIQLRRFFLLGQIIIFFSGILFLFCVMVFARREGILHSLMSKLDTATEAMAGQLRANQVPSSSVSGDYEVFIINQGDGAMVIDRKDQGNSPQKLWESYRTKLTYEMQKEKHGWIVYPDKAPWNLSQEQKIIRYLSIDELHWILAMESSRPTELEILKGSLSPSVLSSLFFILVAGTSLFWLMTVKYFSMLKQRIADTVENNFMSLSGEESMLNKFQVSSSSQAKDEPIELMSSSSAQVQKSFKDPSAEGVMPSVDEREAYLLKKQTAPARPAADQVPCETKGSIEKSKPDPAGLDQLTIDVSAVKSSVLKNMIKKFREK